MKSGGGWSARWAAVGIALLFSGSVPCFGNLVPNPEFLTPPGEPGAPSSWHHGVPGVAGVRPSEFSVGPAGSPPVRALGVRGGEDRAGEWWTTLERLEKGKAYRLFFRVFRETFVDGAYPAVELFGYRKRLNNLFSSGGWQEVDLVFTALSETATLKFVNETPETFYFSTPILTPLAADAGAAARAAGECPPPVPPGFFPLVAYGVKLPEFPFAKELGFNGAVLSVNADTARAAAETAVRTGVSLVAATADPLAVRALGETPALLGWYVEDEPEGRSVPVEEIRAKVRRIREAGSCRPAFMAMVRSEFVRGYAGAADVILMDQYPVPTNSLVWLSKSMEEARRAEAGEVWAVIQIFGGQGWRGKGWDRAPTLAEMRALAYLAVVHGARGLFFYTVKDGNYDLRLDDQHRQEVQKLLRELGALGPWLLGETAAVPGFIPSGLHAFAPDGTMPVHARLLRSGGGTILLAVNVLDKPVEGRITGLSAGVELFKEYGTGRNYVVKEMNILDRFEPHAVKIYLAESGP